MEILCKKRTKSRKAEAGEAAISSEMKRSRAWGQLGEATGFFDGCLGSALGTTVRTTSLLSSHEGCVLMLLEASGTWDAARVSWEMMRERNERCQYTSNQTVGPTEWMGQERHLS